MSEVNTEMSTNTSCVSCKKMDEVKEDASCPHLLSCIIYAKPGKEFKHYVPRDTPP